MTFLSCLMVMVIVGIINSVLNDWPSLPTRV
jgi:hypothetical protein